MTHFKARLVRACKLHAYREASRRSQAERSRSSPWGGPAGRPIQRSGHHPPLPNGRIKRLQRGDSSVDGTSPDWARSLRVVGVVVVVPGQAEPWKVSNAAFRLLRQEAALLAQHPSDTQTLLEAAPNHGLFLGDLEGADRRRMAELMAKSAAQLRMRLLANPEPDDWEWSLIDYLPVLEMWMDGLSQDTSC